MLPGGPAFKASNNVIVVAGCFVTMNQAMKRTPMVPIFVCLILFGGQVSKAFVLVDEFAPWRILGLVRSHGHQGRVASFSGQTSLVQ